MCTGACLDLTHSQRPRLVLAPCVLALRDLSQMCKYVTLTQIQCMWCKE
jgi:hypothetical protein